MPWHAKQSVAVNISNTVVMPSLLVIRLLLWRYFQISDTRGENGSKWMIGYMLIRNTGVYEEPNFISITVLPTMICCLPEHVV